MGLVAPNLEATLRPTLGVSPQLPRVGIEKPLLQFQRRQIRGPIKRDQKEFRNQHQ
jgi:hypothetical protein